MTSEFKAHFLQVRNDVQKPALSIKLYVNKVELIIRLCWLQDLRAERMTLRTNNIYAECYKKRSLFHNVSVIVPVSWSLNLAIHWNV